MRTQRSLRLALTRALPPLQYLTPQDPPPAFELTYLCSGRPFKALIRARNAEAASHEGLLELAHQFHDFDPETARLVAAVQTR